MIDKVLSFLVLYNFFCDILSLLEVKLKLGKKVGDLQEISENFETLKYNPEENSGDILICNSWHSGLYLFQTNFQNLHTPYIVPEEFHQFLGDENTANIFVLHLNIRSINKNFDNLQLFFVILNF